MTTSPANALVAQSGRWLGHAVHPILSDIPIGTRISSVLLDWIGGSDSRTAADRLLVTVVLAAGATVVTGWSDWSDAEAADAAVRRSGLVTPRRTRPPPP